MTLVAKSSERSMAKHRPKCENKPVKLLGDNTAGSLSDLGFDDEFLDIKA